MNRETQAHFAQIPSMDISRSKFDRSFIHKTTCNTGELVPIYVDPDIIPGDTVTMKVADLIRMTTPIVPVMDELKADFYFFFVPNRLTMSNWKKLMGENETAPWIQTTDYVVPQLKIANENEYNYKLTNTVLKGSVLDHMGIPTQYWWKKKGTDSEPKRELTISALPTRAYGMIWNEFFRSEALQNPVYIPTDDTNVNVVNENTSGYITDPDAYQTSYAYRGGLPCLPVCKTFDYFTACLPRPQAGSDVTLPMNGEAPVKTHGFLEEYGTSRYTYGRDSDKLVAKTGSIDGDYATYLFDREYVQTTGTNPSNFDIDPLYATTGMAQGELFADLTEATGATINQLRTAFAIQKWQEREARGGLVA